MPTSIAANKDGSNVGNNLIVDARALLDFYSLIATLQLLIFVLEVKLGMFESLSATQALLKATGMDQVSDVFVNILQ